MTERGALAAEAGARPPRGAARPLGGPARRAGTCCAGEWVRGMSLLLPWGSLLGLAFLAWERIGARSSPRGGSRPAALVAVATLALLLLGVWGWALYDLAGARAAARGAATATRSGRSPRATSAATASPWRAWW